MRFKIILICFFVFVDRIVGVDESRNLLSLVEHNVFAFFDDDMDPEERKLLNNLRIEISGDKVMHMMNNYGRLELLESQIIDYLLSLGNDEQNAYAASKIICRIVFQDIAACGMQTGWIALRAYRPNDLFDIPHWHTDGSFYDTPSKICYRSVYALQGAGTLFVDVPEDVRLEFLGIIPRKKQRPGDKIVSLRERLAALLQDYTPVVAHVGQGAFFIAGSKQRRKAAIHSEPPIHENRLFLAIVPGSSEQIEEWRVRHEHELQSKFLI